MRLLFCAVLAAAFTATLSAAPGATAAATAASREKILFLYDEMNEQSTPYIGRYREIFAAAGIPFDEATAADMKSRDLSPYRLIVVHGMVMAFNAKSPIRDWLKTGPDLRGKNVSLFVTANRWFLKDLFGQLRKLLESRGAVVVDAVSMATKDTDDAAERAAIAAQV
ncbi:MAG: hypothetical protein Q8M76_07245, partial [Spirochaetaceae bacterium]|nr:hypothetical protein [Spirochaetaceae bacterium]